MSFAEEANDTTADKRSEDAVRAAEALLERYDSVMERAVKWYRIECDRGLMARAIARKEESLGRSCCLLSEQTGFGAKEDGVGFVLLQRTRDAMAEWKEEVRVI